ncbi:MAG TPA: alpha-glucosidase C-terminal domain-containing protein [Thermoanaerobaculia bacterium]
MDCNRGSQREPLLSPLVGFHRHEEASIARGELPSRRIPGRHPEVSRRRGEAASVGPVSASAIRRKLPPHRARKGSTALRKGTLTLLSPTNRSTPVLAFVREHQGERVLVVHNLGTAEAEAGPYTLPGAAAEPLFTSAEIAAPVSGPEGWRVHLPAGASGAWVLSPR